MKSKYNNVKTTKKINGDIVTFDSKKEAKRYDELYILLNSGAIEQLTLQPKFMLLTTLRVEGHRTMPVRYYIADFKYIEKGLTIVEDVKGMKTPMYNLKKHMFLDLYRDKLTFKEI